MPTLYRAMKVDHVDGMPLAESTARGLGVRPGIDIPVDDFGLVDPGGGGMSVSPDAIDNLPPWRRPPEHGGSGDDPVWQIGDEELLGAGGYGRAYPQADLLQRAQSTRLRFGSPR